MDAILEKNVAPAPGANHQGVTAKIPGIAAVACYSAGPVFNAVAAQNLLHGAKKSPLFK